VAFEELKEKTLTAAYKPRRSLLIEKHEPHGIIRGPGGRVDAECGRRFDSTGFCLRLRTEGNQYLGSRPAKGPVKLLQCLPRLRGMETDGKRESKAKSLLEYPVKQLKIS
jgi:hypothetical protein